MAIDTSIYSQIRPVQQPDPLETIGRLLSIRQAVQMQPVQMQEAQERLKATQAENQQRQQAITDDRAAREFFAKNPNATPEDMISTLGPKVAHPIIESMYKSDKSRLEMGAERAKQWGQIAGSIKDDASFQNGVATALSRNLIDAPAAQKYLQQGWNPQTAAQVQQIASQAMTAEQQHSAALADLEERRKALLFPDQQRKGTAEANNAEAQTAGIQADSTLKAAKAKALTDMSLADWQQAINDTIADKKSPLYQRTQSAVQLALKRGNLEAADKAIKDAGDQLGRTETAVATAKATAPTKIEIAAAGASARADAAGLTPDDYARAGEQYARTGIMPGLGRDSVTRARIVQAGNQWARDNGLAPADLVTMQAAYQGDKKSLENFQKQRDQIVSFEQTAQKNLDLFLNAASKIPDSGVPWLNAPLRSLSKNLVGSQNMAAVDAARQIANIEIAKVTSGGGLGGVLSDTARKEVQQYNPNTATFAQTLAIAKMLKQDMANRHQSMDATLGDIKSRIGGGQGASSNAPKVEKWGFDAKGNLVKQ